MQDTIIMRVLTRCVRCYPTELNRLFVTRWLTYVSEDIGLKHNGTYRMGDKEDDE